MTMSGIAKCSVPGCSGSVDGYSNLCDNHRVPGTKLVNGESTMMITIWVAEHNGELGFILLNDYALGQLVRWPRRIRGEASRATLYKGAERRFAATTRYRAGEGGTPCELVWSVEDGVPVGIGVTLPNPAPMKGN
jgi:hypothetical protein